MKTIAWIAFLELCYMKGCPIQRWKKTNRTGADWQLTITYALGFREGWFYATGEAL